jgi:hypothetical protein
MSVSGLIFIYKVPKNIIPSLLTRVLFQKRAYAACKQMTMQSDAACTYQTSNYNLGM